MPGPSLCKGRDFVFDEGKIASMFFMKMIRTFNLFFLSKGQHASDPSNEMLKVFMSTPAFICKTHICLWKMDLSLLNKSHEEIVFCFVQKLIFFQSVNVKEKKKRKKDHLEIQTAQHSIYRQPAVLS